MAPIRKAGSAGSRPVAKAAAGKKVAAKPIARQKPGLKKEGLKKERPVAGNNKNSVASKDVVKRATPPQRPTTTGKASPIRSFGEATKGSTEVKKAPPKGPGVAQRIAKGNKTEVGDKKNIGPKNTQLEPRQKLREKREALGKKSAERPVQKKAEPGTKGSKSRFPFR